MSNEIVDNTRQFILGNDKIEDKLHVIAVISNPCNYKIRYSLANDFFKRMEDDSNIILYIVELVYGKQEFAVTTDTNKRHLQLRGETPLWHKENIINLGVKYLLPNDWKAMAWIDADIEFENPHWASDALKILNNGNDFIQLFTHAINMDYSKNILTTFTGFGYQYSKNLKKNSTENQYWHPGFAWACNRNTYDKIGGIFQEGVLGSGDNIMCHMIIKKAPESLKKGMDESYIKFIENIQSKFEGVKLGYVPGNIRHFYHGKKENRNYNGRDDILINHKYNPYTYITTDDVGLIIPTKDCPKDFIKDIMSYFEERNEDEIVLEKIMSKPKDDKDVVKYKIEYIFNQFEKFKEDLVSIQEIKTKPLQQPKPQQQQPYYQQPYYQQPYYQQPYYQQPYYQQPYYQQPYQQHYQQQQPQPPYQQKPFTDSNSQLNSLQQAYSKALRFKGMSFR
jgi:hypothetical protein